MLEKLVRTMYPGIMYSLPHQETGVEKNKNAFHFVMEQPNPPPRYSTKNGAKKERNPDDSGLGSGVS